MSLLGTRIKRHSEAWDSTATVKEELILKHIPLIKYLAERIAIRLPPNISKEDLVSAGIIGLIDAVEKYDPSKGTQFETYARMRIRGAIFDELRSMDWIPRSMRTKANLIENVYIKLEKVLKRPPDDEEVASEMGMGLDEFYKLSDGIRGVFLLNEGDVNDLYADDEDSAIKLHEMRETLASAIKDLPEKERLVISLYYYEELTMKEIGHILGRSESRVCQVHTKAILRLRAKLKRHGPFE